MLKTAVGIRTPAVSQGNGREDRRKTWSSLSGQPKVYVPQSNRNTRDPASKQGDQWELAPECCALTSTRALCHVCAHTHTHKKTHKSQRGITYVFIFYFINLLGGCLQVIGQPQVFFLTFTLFEIGFLAPCFIYQANEPPGFQECWNYSCRCYCAQLYVPLETWTQVFTHPRKAFYPLSPSLAHTLSLQILTSGNSCCSDGWSEPHSCAHRPH